MLGQLERVAVVLVAASAVAVAAGEVVPQKTVYQAAVVAHTHWEHYLVAMDTSVVPQMLPVW